MNLSHLGSGPGFLPDFKQLLSGFAVNSITSPHSRVEVGDHLLTLRRSFSIVFGAEASDISDTS